MNIFGKDTNIEVSVSNNLIRIYGQVQNIADYALIREKIVEMISNNFRDIKIVFEESNAVTSSIIGFLLKVTQKDKINIHVVAKNEDLYLLFEILGLIDIFKVTKSE
ncbi:MAG: hypothetical protein RMI30_00470 [Thermodesulfovibrio sp.]|nr:hypothetical protein [Thermodesulfovibrio sp.]MDW7997916.1 hypothetical protein [Thermodesulfovibrio sp.]